jgi:TolB-like protein/predicted Ser/Thr protein kinase/Tfp pilus assembly protein PilF
VVGVTRLCRKCGAKIVAHAPDGLCVACVLETGLHLFAHPVPSSVGDSGQEDKITGRQGNAMDQAQATAHETKPPQHFGDYELLKEIGRGGQGVVYRATQKSLNRTVALKVISTGHRATQARLKRFRLEAATAASLDNRNIVGIYEIGEREGSCYFSMKLVEGGPLDQLYGREPMAVRGAAELIAKLARAVHYAHQRGVLHRDIKPGNILLDSKGEPHLTDFGLARLTETDSTVTRTLDTLGTPSYMAPEQALGNNNQLTVATDVYGLGAVLYHVLTGHPPFAGGTSYDTIRLLLETEPREPRLWNAQIDPDLATVCLKCLEKNPEHRYSTALALAEDLERWLKHRPIKARRSGIFTRAKKWGRRNPLAAAVIVLSVALAASLSVIVWKVGPTGGEPATRIAVLPFENLSNDREDASFADGVQDDVVTKLANIAALKVISRTSVMQYRGEQNTREIGHALRVSHVVEGSVRKTGAWLHVNAQLVDARTDSHVWAKQYDGDLRDVFIVQSEIAKNVAEQLHAKVSPAEKLAIEQPPTANVTAFNLYSRAKSLLLMATFGTRVRANLLEAADLLNQAVVNDPSFFQAYCQLASVNDLLYFLGEDHTPERLALAETAIQAAFRLRPNAAEAHLAHAGHLFRGNLDYERALAELEIARRTIPADPRIFELKGHIERRQGNSIQSVQSFEQAIDLDPRNVFILQQLAMTYDDVRRCAEEKAVWDRALTIVPDDVGMQLARAFVEFNWKANTEPLHRVIEEIRAKNPSAIETIADSWLISALAERNPAAAASALAALGENSINDQAVRLSPRFAEGVIARMTKDDLRARAAFTAARAEQAKIVQDQPDYAPALCVLGLIDAGLGRKEEALREGRHAVELLLAEKDAISDARVIMYLAIIAAWVGDKELACEQLPVALRYPNPPSYGELKLLPFWDPLRGEPFFEKIVASLAPTDAHLTR